MINASPEDCSVPRLIQIQTIVNTKSVSPYASESFDDDDNDIETKRRKTTRSMDQVFPHLCYRIMNWGNFRLGRGCDPLASIGRGDTKFGCFALIETYEDEAGVRCPVTFTDLDELVYALEKGMTEQESEDREKYTVFYKYREADGRTTKERVKDPSRNIDLVVRPKSEAVEDELEWKETFVYDSGVVGDRQIIKCLYTSGFNYSLSTSFDLKGAKAKFSFKMEFPKCARWLTYPIFSGKNAYYWFQVERGVLRAMRGKADHKKGKETMIYETPVCSNVHEMFTIMENMLILPRQWK